MCAVTGVQERAQEECVPDNSSHVICNGVCVVVFNLITADSLSLGRSLSI